METEILTPEKLAADLVAARAIYPGAPPPDENRWQMFVPVISTAHITEQDNAVLSTPDSSPSPLLGVLRNGCGYLIYLGGADEINRFEPDEWPAEMSLAFAHLFNTFAALGYEYLRLDGEGDKIPGLPTFDW